MDRKVEVQHLAQADRHISGAERIIDHQIMEVAWLRDGRHSTALAEQMLATFQRTLAAMQDHRNTIIRTIKAIDKGLI